MAISKIERTEERRKLLQESLDIAHNLYRKEKFVECYGWLHQVIKVDSSVPELWRLLSVVAGNLNLPEESRKCLLKLWELGAAISDDKINLITASLHAGELVDAQRFTLEFFDSAPDEIQRGIVEAYIEAVRSETISPNELPPMIHKYIEGLDILFWS